MKDYYDLYLKCDVLSLDDVFEKLKIILAHYLSVPVLSWDAILI